MNISNLDEFARFFFDTLGVPFPETVDYRLTLTDIGLDSLGIVVVLEALRGEFGEFEIEATDGFVDPTWSLAEFHHMVASTVERMS